MTLDEAKAVGRIASTADGGCSTCVRSLTEMLAAQFPQFTWTYPGERWKDEEGWSYDGIDVDSIQ